MNRPVRIVVACGAAIAQSTMLKMQLIDAFDERKVALDINHCTLAEIPGKVSSFDPDFVITSSPVPFEVPEKCHPMVGLPLFTGFGKEELLEEIFAIVENDLHD